METRTYTDKHKFYWDFIRGYLWFHTLIKKL